MRRWEFGGLVFLLFCLSLFCSVTINYAAAGAYEENMKKVPVPNPNCTRFLPQFSDGTNNGEKVQSVDFIFLNFLRNLRKVEV
jgi:hypothetical protein